MKIYYSTATNYIIIVEAVNLIGEGEYNLNVLKEIRVTESFLGLDQDVRQCQHKEPLNNCTTRQYLDTFLGECGCLPLNIRLFHKVTFKITWSK